MNLNKIYFHINNILEEYLDKGVQPEHLVSYLNNDEDNFKYLYNKIYKKLTLENVQFESDVLIDCIKDNIQDKIALLTDIKTK